MKRIHIILLIVVALSIGVIIAMSGDYTTYADFIQAKQKEGKAVNVVGYLVKEKEIVYDPKTDPNFFAFTMTDKEGNECKVVYKGSKPQDFERSEQLVVKGKMEGEVFKCSEIAMKCPSKYVNDEIQLNEKNEVVVQAGA
jgi:cytochrome c-type biogenesis protein CcmE